MLGLIKTYRKVIFAVIVVIGFALGVVNGDQLINLLASKDTQKVANFPQKAYQVEMYLPAQAQNHHKMYSLKGC